MAFSCSPKSACLILAILCLFGASGVVFKNISELSELWDAWEVADDELDFQDRDFCKIQLGFSLYLVGFGESAFSPKNICTGPYGTFLMARTLWSLIIHAMYIPASLRLFVGALQSDEELVFKFILVQNCHIALMVGNICMYFFVVAVGMEACYSSFLVMSWLIVEGLVAYLISLIPSSLEKQILRAQAGAGGRGAVLEEIGGEDLEETGDVEAEMEGADLN